MAQRYASLVAQNRMASGMCPECGKPASEHSADSRFWLPRPNDCSLRPVGVADRIEQYQEDLKTGEIQ